MTVVFYHVDAFTQDAFKGNPAGVCLLTKPADEKWMQNIAMEINLSETAFLWPLKDGYSLRWFTPVSEVDLCGHATLASAHVLWESGELNRDSDARFYTKSGLLTAHREEDWIELNFPSEPEEKTIPPQFLLDGLGIEATYIGKNRFDYLIEVNSEAAVRRIMPNWTLLKKIDTRGIIVTSRSTSPDYDFISRAFFPSIGINEDPVTGSAHCCLGPYWQHKLSKNELIGYQASQRGGMVKVHVHGERVLLAGRAITVMKGEIQV